MSTVDIEVLKAFESAGVAPALVEKGRARAQQAGG